MIVGHSAGHVPRNAPWRLAFEGWAAVAPAFYGAVTTPVSAPLVAFVGCGAVAALGRYTGRLTRSLDQVLAKAAPLQVLRARFCRAPKG